MAENSPTFQRWGRECRGAQVPKGRLKPCAIRQPSLRDLSDHGRWFPTLKRWAIIECPSGTKTCPGLAYFVGANPSGIGQECPRSDGVSRALPHHDCIIVVGFFTHGFSLTCRRDYIRMNSMMAECRWCERNIHTAAGVVAGEGFPPSSPPRLQEACQQDRQQIALRASF
jgi:hypothetical protein